MDTDTVVAVVFYFGGWIPSVAILSIIFQIFASVWEFVQWLGGHVTEEDLGWG